MNRYCIICNEQYNTEIHTIGVIHRDNVQALNAMIECIDDIVEASRTWPTKRLEDFRISLDLFVCPLNSYFSKVYAFIMMGNLDRIIKERIESKQWIRDNLLIKDVADIVISYMD